MEKSRLIKKIGNVDFELTYLCNLDCLHCYNPLHTKTEEFATDEVVSLTKEIKQAGFDEIHYNGGEPLIRKDIRDILSASTQLGMKTLLETNATLLKPSHIRNLKDLIIRASLDGSEIVHNEIRKGTPSNAYQNCLKNLAGVEEHGIPVQLTCSINGLNFDSIYQMVKEVQEYGLDDIRLRLTMPTGSAIKNWTKLAMNEEQLKTVRKTARRIKNDYPNVNFDSSSLNRGIPKFEPKFFIDPRGLVKPYPFIESYVGNLRQEPIEEILGKIPRFRLPTEEENRMVGYLTKIGMVSEE